MFDISIELSTTQDGSVFLPVRFLFPLSLSPANKFFEQNIYSISKQRNLSLKVIFWLCNLIITFLDKTLKTQWIEQFLLWIWFRFSFA